MKLIPNDAKGFERAVYIFAETFCPALILFLILSALQVFHNDYSDACKGVFWAWKVFGVVLLGVAGVQFWAMKEDRLEATRGSLFVLFILLAASFCSFAGFNL